MAETPQPVLDFPGGCPDCGRRQVEMPRRLPELGDEFDFRVRDFDGFRLYMLDQLAARFPERKRWTPADMEVVLIEVLAAVLDQLSDMADRVAAEAYLETARQPRSVHRLLKMIGYDVFTEDPSAAGAGLSELNLLSEKWQRLEAFWLTHPEWMEAARREGPRRLREQHRMVTLDDYGTKLAEHPLVLAAKARKVWSGSWWSIRCAVLNWRHLELDQPLEDSGGTLPDEMVARIRDFHGRRGLSLPADVKGAHLRTVLRSYIDAYRMIGSEVLLENVIPAGISMSVSVVVTGNYFRSEVQRAVEQALGQGPGGFFEPGALGFGEDIHASDIIALLKGLRGVRDVCLNRFKRVGRDFPDQSVSGIIELDGIEVGVCDNDPGKPERGYYQLKLHEGRTG